ncbi:MAG TPA: type II toxin-antitoxin system VapC family toxin [Candidatus Dormibacteraeota bacterium]|nr:type II toxin-antitoxin system VapC family toxin [Candidatus Dormibacteraeota bacterium]
MDSSVVLAWLLPDEHSHDAESILTRMRDESAAAPALLRVEVGSALLAASRRGRISDDSLSEAFVKFEAYPIDIVPIETEHVREAMTLGTRYALTVYDALYLRLAAAHQAVLCSYDAALLAAASRHGVACG